MNHKRIYLHLCLTTIFRFSSNSIGFKSLFLNFYPIKSLPNSIYIWPSPKLYNYWQEKLREKPYLCRWSFTVDCCLDLKWTPLHRPPLYGHWSSHERQDERPNFEVLAKRDENLNFSQLGKMSLIWETWSIWPRETSQW